MIKAALLALGAFLLMAFTTTDEIGALIQAGKLEQAFHLAEQKATAGDHEGEEALGWFYQFGKFVPKDEAKAAAWYRKAAEAGLQHAQWRLGVALDEGKGVPENPAEAFAWFEKSAAQGYGKGLSGLGVMYHNGRGTTRDFAKARDYYVRAARAGEPHGFFGVGALSLAGQGVREDPGEAFSWFMVALQQRDRWPGTDSAPRPRECASATQSGQSTGSKQSAASSACLRRIAAPFPSRERETALRLRGSAAAAQASGVSPFGDASSPMRKPRGPKAMIVRKLALVSAFVLLTAFSTAEEIEALVLAGKLEQGFRLAEQRAASGDREADNALGWFYDRGKFVAEDDRKAVDHYRKAAEAGLSRAQWRLGVMLDEGEGVEANPGEAFAWLSKAAAQDYSLAMVSLGVMHALGRGTEVDYGQSRSWYLKAARAGEPHGFYGIGTLHALGQGVPEDRVEGLAWLMAAATLGNEPAKEAATQFGLDHDRTRAAADRATAILAEFGHPNRKVEFRDLDREREKATPNA